MAIAREADPRTPLRRPSAGGSRDRRPREAYRRLSVAPRRVHERLALGGGRDMVIRATVDQRSERVWAELAHIADPEIPAISLVDLGVIGSVTVDDERVRVQLLPTFIGCPAIGLMQEQIAARVGALRVADDVEVTISFDPPWTSDRISARGRERLRLSGFAP